MPGPRRLGSEAEDRAASYLLAKGYTIVTRRYKARRGEIDLVTLDGDVLVFVEVKQRKAGYLPEESITAAKARRMGLAANEYLEATGEAGREVRFDVVSINPREVRHHVDAFRPSGPGSIGGLDEESDEFTIDS